ncbi:unnamed protein product [Heligmosomoides polygyrus]|uniref:Dynamin_M domain-containing protein n=1 Tax=Heligmosomoides polygyrus TaxID=6339 RepID=A0A183FP39_HELPZ|nr:unnamed protein product [Heligmosomoides polygyrus]
MSLKCFPLLYVNMAGEMIYILEQRIKNQKNISEEKGDLVLHDIISQTLKQKYLHEIFKYPTLPTVTEIHMRAMFERLAHSSIMRLSESSMEKLFDLTLMMTKYQIQSVVMPEQILTVTMNHLSGMRRIAKQEDDIQELIRNAHAMVDYFRRSGGVRSWVLRSSSGEAHTGRCAKDASRSRTRQNPQIQSSHLKCKYATAQENRTLTSLA